MDPDPDPTPDPTFFFSDIKDAKKFSHNLTAGTLSSVFKLDNKLFRDTKLYRQSLHYSTYSYKIKSKDPDPDPHI
jgi:hypothetical protein